jgi:hypothetical protein
MTSGVYELKFSNGARYIGKSINIETRWKQHMDKFQKGTAAKAMQSAYNNYGAPEGTIIMKCHSDHIDIMEAVYIARHCPELNSDRPVDPFLGIDIDWYVRNTNLLSCSTITHMESLVASGKREKTFVSYIKVLEGEVKELEGLNDDLLKVRSDETIKRDTTGMIKQLLDNNTKRQSLLDSAVREIEGLKVQLAYHSKPWWTKIFN